MAYFSRFSSFPIPRWGNPMGQRHNSQRSEEEKQVPFIPPNFDDDEEEEEEEELQQETSVLPHPQPQYHNVLIPLKVYKYRPSKGDWKHVPVTGLHDNGSRHAQESRSSPPPPTSQVRIISWNVDMSSQHHEERMHAALRHLEEEVLNCKDGEAPEPCCILLQEVRDMVLPFLLKDPWVRRWFVVTPFTKDKWPEAAFYGNLTLVSRTLDIAESHILHYGFTNMQRTAVCVKLKLNYPGSQDKAVVAVQLEMCSRFLRLEGVNGGVIAGDMNAISKDDATIGKNVGLRDSWRKGDDEKGYTWGYQGQNDGGRHPPNRLDKIYYLAGMGYKVEEPRRIGMGLKIKEGTPQAMWVSDHYGLDTVLRIKGRSQSS
ncbi:hypothetical protein BJ912DRAFT_975663 [Pholiota molesta]|nr:hypothetical protein BJ912DRAFT_975663 [Pholiota molesta]